MTVLMNAEREFPVLEELCLDNSSGADSDRRGVKITGSCWFRAVGGVSDFCTFRAFGKC